MDEEPEDPVTLERQIVLIAAGYLWGSDSRSANPMARKLALYLARRAGGEAALKELEGPNREL